MRSDRTSKHRTLNLCLRLMPGKVWVQLGFLSLRSADFRLKGVQAVGSWVLELVEYLKPFQKESTDPMRL